MTGVAAALAHTLAVVLVRAAARTALRVGHRRRRHRGRRQLGRLVAPDALPHSRFAHTCDRNTGVLQHTACCDTMRTSAQPAYYPVVAVLAIGG